LKNDPSPEAIARGEFDDDDWDGREIHRLETIRNSPQPVTVVGLFGGNVFWGKCRWRLAGSVSVSVSVLCSVGSGRLIAGTESGVFLLAYGSGIGKCRKVTAICWVPGTPLKILVWD
jgi:hypothetical protein